LNVLYIHSHFVRFLTVFFFLVIEIQSAFANNDTIIGRITETFSGQALAFVHITIHPSGNEYVSDIDGHFTIPFPAAGSILKFERFLHRDVEIETTGSPIPGDTLLVKMNRYQLFPPLPETDLFTEHIIKNTINLAPENNINRKKRISYQTYNKLTIDIDNHKKVNDIFRKLRSTGWFKIDNISGNQHLYILESAATRKILNNNNQIEKVDALMSSGLRIPGVALLGTHLQHFNIYEDFVDLAGKKYFSPLAHFYSINLYHYQIIDTLNLPDGIYYAVAFAPKKNKNFSALEGIMFIHTGDYSVRHALVSPAFEKKGLTEVSISYTVFEQDLFPVRQRIYMGGTENVGGLAPIIQTNTWYHFYRTSQPFFNRQFDERILSYDDNSIDKDTNYWNQIRQTPATLTDKNTYTYFYNGMNTYMLQKFLNIGQNVYFGKLPIGKIDFDLNKMLNHNQAEGLRLGMGGSTNYKFSETWQLSAFLGYGFKDNRWKYGAGVKRLLYAPLELYGGFSYSKELQEAGAQQLPFESMQYSTESLRRILVKYMDYTDKFLWSLQAHPITYLDYNMSFSYQHTLPNYTYAFKGDTLSHINYLEWSNGLRYAFGEKVIQINDEKIKLESKYPILYLNIDKGFKIEHQPFSFTRYEFKIDQFIKIFEIGKTGIELTGGATTGNAPYSRLFAGKGSYRSAGVVVHNSFETMGYNEFAASKYVALFMSHDFGRMYYRSSFFMPNFMIIYNIGWGVLNNASYQAGPPMKSYEKGYKEFGGFLNNIVVLKLSGLKAGIGAGVFFRYGAYQLPVLTDNAVFKFTLNLMPGS
jgi:hypothetical protein